MTRQQFLRLVLFDIDGTLITTNGIARACFTEAMEERFQRVVNGGSYDFAGKTDLQIYHDLCRASDITDEEAERGRDRFFDRFFALLERRLTEDNVTVLPGVRPLLDALEAEEPATTALLTGNMLHGARIKLTPPGLLRHFTFGAFGSDAHHRHELPAIAQARAYDKVGVMFKAKEIVIIGDTPHDIDCGRHLNVKSIAVATGGYSNEQLATHGPDFVFSTLEDTNAILDAIFT